MKDSSFSDKTLLGEISGLRKRVNELEAQLADLYKTNLPDLSGFGQKANGANIGLWEWEENKSDKSILSKPGLFQDLKDPELVHADDFQRIEKEWRAFIAGEKGDFNEEYRIIQKDGSCRWIKSQAKITRDPTGAPVRICGSNADITFQKLLERSLKNSQKKYHRLFENSINGILRINLTSGMIVEANKKSWDILNNKPVDSFRELETFLFKDQPDILSELKKRKTLHNIELKLLAREENERWVSLSANYYQDEDLAEFIIADITDTKRSIIELQKMNFELDNFVYHSSHDLRSPLKSILGLINILRLENDKAAQQNCIEMIEGSIIRLDKLVNDLLSLSRNNRINDNFVAINLMEELNNAVTNFYHTADTKNLEIVPRIYQPVPLITDLTRLRIILNNLISNAIKYRRHSRRSSYVKIVAKVTPDKASIIIEDNGIGIAQSKVNKVFDMFYRASEASEGSGLGLYIVKNVVEKMNGSILLTSKEKTGSTFTIDIPNHWDGKNDSYFSIF